MPIGSDDLREDRGRRRAFLKAASAAAAGGAAASFIGAEPAAAQTPAPLMLNVKDFGAVGNGTTNDTNAIKSALQNALGTSAFMNTGLPADERSAGPALFFPVGIYYCPGLQHDITWPVTLLGVGGAILVQDGAHSGGVFRCSASIDVEGLEFKNGGFWFDYRAFTSPGASVPRIRIANCIFRKSGSPLWAESAHGGADRLVIEGNYVTADYHNTTCKGIVFGTLRYRSVLVSGNRVENTFQYGLRVGGDDTSPTPYLNQTDVVCVGNSVSGVWQPTGSQSLSTNGIRMQGKRVVVSDNVVNDVATGTETQVEGIYVKGDTMVIAGNVLLDAGGNEGQIVAKGNKVLIADNRVEFASATPPGGAGIRVGGATDVQILGNEVIGTPPGLQAMSLQEHVLDTAVVAGNIVRGGAPERGLVTDGRKRVIVKDNTFADLTPSAEVVGVRTTGTNAVDQVEHVVIEGNVFVRSSRATRSSRWVPRCGWRRRARAPSRKRSCTATPTSTSPRASRTLRAFPPTSRTTPELPVIRALTACVDVGAGSRVRHRRMAGVTFRRHHHRGGWVHGIVLRARRRRAPAASGAEASAGAPARCAAGVAGRAGGVQPAPARVRRLRHDHRRRARRRSG
jgi:hypothetical protein